MTLGATERRQLAWITGGAVAVYALLRLLPTGTNLSHMDFRADAKNSIEFCDPLNPQFIPVVAVASPVTMALRALAGAPRAGTEAAFALTLATAAGKPIGPQDLAVSHTRKLHLLVVDEALRDYQHVHPSPGARAGEWRFSFSPRAGGNYRCFADFTPSATGRGLYASTDFSVSPSDGGGKPTTDRPATNWSVARDAWRFQLTPAAQPVRARATTELKLAITRADGGPVPLAPVMGAFAHLVAFDERRTGFAHLHPAESDVTRQPDPRKPELSFKVTIPRAGRYVIWAQVNLGGREEFAPFWFEVVE
ncbi:MAG: hypothetical protein RLZZ15_2310 [Verrucomicrobiota bacterium]